MTEPHLAFMGFGHKSVLTGNSIGHASAHWCILKAAAGGMRV